MNDTLKTELWKQFGASIDMLENAIAKCPPELWNDERKFWYTAYHTLFFLDYYLDTNPDNFITPEPFGMTEMEIDEVMPERTFTKAELLSYVKHCRGKASKLIGGFNEKTAASRWKNRYREYSMLEMQLYNMRHLMHHTGQLNLLLGQIDHDLPVWVSQTKVEL
jgi:hypothetical protein